MIDRRAFLGAAALGVLALPRLGEARLRALFRVPRVGVLGETNPIPWIVRTAVVDIECRWADAERAPLVDLASELLARDVDVLVALGAASARAATPHAAGVPIVVVADADLGEDAAVARLAQSVGNVTWLSAPSEGAMALQRLGRLRRLVPRLRRVAVLFNPDSAANVRAMTRLSARPLAAAIRLRWFPARSDEEVDAVFRALARDPVDGLLVLADASFTAHAARLVELAAAARLPAAYGARAFVEAGGLVAVSGDTGDTICRTVTIVRRILAGQTPATVPPPRPHIALNVSAAARLGLRPSAPLLAEADVLRAV